MDADFWSSGETIGILYALALSALLVVTGYVTGVIAERREVESFLAIVIGGMFVRLVIALALVWFLISQVQVDPMSFCLTFFISYFIFMMTEIFYVNYRYGVVVQKRRTTIRK